MRRRVEGLSPASALSGHEVFTRTVSTHGLKQPRTRGAVELYRRSYLELLRSAVRKGAYYLSRVSSQPGRTERVQGAMENVQRTELPEGHSYAVEGRELRDLPPAA